MGHVHDGATSPAVIPPPDRSAGIDKAIIVGSSLIGDGAVSTPRPCRRCRSSMRPVRLFI